MRIFRERFEAALALARASKPEEALAVIYEALYVAMYACDIRWLLRFCSTGAIIAEATGQLEEAKRLYLLALDADRDDPRSLLFLSRISEALCDFESASEYRSRCEKSA